MIQNDKREKIGGIYCCFCVNTTQAPLHHNVANKTIGYRRYLVATMFVKITNIKTMDNFFSLQTSILERILKDRCQRHLLDIETC